MTETWKFFRLIFKDTGGSEILFSLKTLGISNRELLFSLSLLFFGEAVCVSMLLSYVRIELAITIKAKRLEETRDFSERVLFAV